MCFTVVLSESRYLPWNNVVENCVNISIRPVSFEGTVYRTIEEYHIKVSLLDKSKLRTLVIFFVVNACLKLIRT